MSRLPKPGTAEKAVILKMTSPDRPVPSWSYKGGHTLYESRALTELLCQRLVIRGWLDEIHEADCVRYRVNGVGLEEAAKLRSEEATAEILGFLDPTGR